MATLCESPRPLSAPSRPHVRLQRLKPLHTGIAGQAQLLSVVEAVLQSRDAGHTAASDLTSVEGLRSVLRAEPSLAWAELHGAECFKLLRERITAQEAAANRCTRVSGRGHSRRSQVLAGRLCGSVGRLPPMGGGGPGCLSMMTRSNSAKNAAAVASHATAFKLAGVDEEMAACLSERLDHLSFAQPGVIAWLVVEACRECSTHSTTFRHEEKAYVSRYTKLKKHIERRFPARLAVDILVPREAVVSQTVCCDAPGCGVPLRIGAFEVYLCVAEPMTPFGSVPLPAPQEAKGGGRQDEEPERTAAFSAVCVASKLQTLAWPVADDMVLRLVKAMPRVPLCVSVHTGAELPVPGVDLAVFPATLLLSSDSAESEAADFCGSVLASGTTDERGACKLMVPFLVPLRVCAWHELLMALQEREVVITSDSAAEDFTAETVTQMWQAEEGKELVVYCSSPRSCPDPPTKNCKPFQGRLLGSPVGELRPNAHGFIRGDHGLLDDVSTAACNGWRSGDFALATDAIRGTGQAVEVARLSAPLVKVSLVSACCGTPLPRARVFIDKEDFGDTGKSGAAVVCTVKCGEHSLQVKHMLVPESLMSPLSVTSSAPCGVQVRLSPQRLRFVCVRQAATPEQPTTTDIWLVAGRVGEWRRSLKGPTSSADVWLWDGELRGPTDTFTVKAGILQWSTSNNGSGRNSCQFTDGLVQPKSLASDQWQVAWHPRLLRGSCVLSLVAQAAREKATPARWMARLMTRHTGAQASEPAKMRVRLRTVCCCRAIKGACVKAIGKEVSLDEEGLGDLPRTRGTEMTIKVENVPHSLLPGGVGDFVAYQSSESRCVELDVLCNFWVYWVPPEEDEDDLDSEEPLPYNNGMLWFAVDGTHLPDEAEAVGGVVRCAEAAGGEVELDGTVGPYQMKPNPPVEKDAQCLLAGMKFDIKPPSGFEFFATDPSPLYERCAELGECELQRLFQCPAVVGTFKPFLPPRPYRVVVRSSCCGCASAEVGAIADGVELSHFPGRPGCFRLPRRKLGDMSGRLSLRLENIYSCLLPGGCSEQQLPYSLDEPECIELGIACSLWVYWVPPQESEEDDGELEEEEVPEGLLWVACSAEQVPSEARPVVGKLNCTDAVPEQLTLDGTSMGPFLFQPSDDLPELEEASNLECLLARLDFQMTPPEGFLVEGFSFIPRNPSPLAERCEELGGCELQRLVHCPIAVGNFRANPLPLLHLSLRTSCCGCGFAGASVGVNGKDPLSFDDSGAVELTRRRKGTVMNLAFESVPPYMLPGGSRNNAIRYGPLEPKSVDLEVMCLVWVYWIPPDDDEECGDLDDEDADGSIEFADGLLWMACDPDQIPEEARPVEGRLECTSAEIDEIVLDGKSLGPFSLRMADVEADGNCILAGLSFAMNAPSGFEFLAKTPSPLAERCAELGGCEMQRLLQCPIVVGTFKSLPAVPPFRVKCQSTCCSRGFPCAYVNVNGIKAEANSQNSLFRLPRRRREERQGELQIDVGEVPAGLLPNGVSSAAVPFALGEPNCLDMDISCLLWVYWVPPDDEEEEEDEDLDPPDGLLWVAVEAAHVPDEAQPVEGVLECPGAVDHKVELAGVKTGPFELKIQPDARDATDQCLLARLRFHIKAPQYFEFHPRDPSPLEQRVEELGGCELQRLVQCPSAVGSFKQLPLPKLKLTLRTTCCRSPFCGAGASINGKDVVPFDEGGAMEITRKRKGGALRLSLDAVPPQLLPGGSRETTANYGPFEPLTIALDVVCLVWVYWVPPDEEEEEEEAGEEGEEMPPPEGTLWVACDKEQVADEAQPVKGTLECPSAVEKRVVLNGSSMGPFQLLLPPGATAAACLLSELAVSITRKDGFAYRAKSPSPLAERCEELGGCELERLLGCPAMMGFLRPVPPEEED